MHPVIQGLMSLFAGYSRAHGAYGAKLLAADGKKLKGKAATLIAPVTVELWNSHITGEQGLGVIPVTENGTVMFAAIDIDTYPLDLVKLNSRIQQHKLPLILCRTKSGGAHLYLFMREWSDAKIVQKRMREFASMLGHGNAEIFPKQSIIMPDRGDIGSWINMPYFHAVKTTRYALSETSEELSPQDFIDYAHSKRLTIQELELVEDAVAEPLEGGPPCLNHLVSMGFPEGSRNNGLFNMGVYAQKIAPEGWQALVEEYNQKYMRPPLTTQEVLGVMKSLLKKKFNYTCKNPPIAQYCNMPKCRTCQFGVGSKGAGLPKFGSLTKLITDPPIWFLEVDDGGRLELTTEELQNQMAFQRKCLSVLNIMPTKIKQDAWEEIIQNLLTEVTIAEIPLESTPAGQLRQHLEDFCTTRAQARNPDEIILGKPWTSNGLHHFRMQDFFDYLNRKRFDLVPQNKIAMHLREWKSGKRFFNIKGKGVNTVTMPEFIEQQKEPFDAPERKTDTPY